MSDVKRVTLGIGWYEGSQTWENPTDDDSLDGAWVLAEDYDWLKAEQDTAKNSWKAMHVELSTLKADYGLLAARFADLLEKTAAMTADHDAEIAALTQANGETLAAVKAELDEADVSLSGIIEAMEAYRRDLDADVDARTATDAAMEIIEEDIDMLLHARDEKGETT